MSAPATIPPPIALARPLIGAEEEDAVLRVLRSGGLAQGIEVAAFEREFAECVGVRHAVAVSSGTAALHLALLAHGIGEGDEVITSPFTFIASANAALYVGARPVFADIDRATYNLDPSSAERKITPRTRAVMPVHLYGHPADMAAFRDLADRHGLALIEDAAQAIGAALGGRAVGSFGTGCFSLYPTKNITSGEGGMITTDDDEVAARLRLLRNHGQGARYRHDILGYNLRMTDLHAAIGRAQLRKLEPFTRARQSNAAALTAGLHEHVVSPVCRPTARHVYHQYTVRVPDGRRDAVATRLSERGIGCAVHYPAPVHQQPLYRDLGYTDHLPEAEEAARTILCLPVHPGLSEGEIKRIVTEVQEACCA